MGRPDPMEQYLSELRVGNEQARGVIYRSTSTDNRHRRENAPMLSSLSRATAGPASLTYLTLGPPRVLSGYVDVVVAQTIGGRPARSRPTRWLTRLYRRLSLSPLIGHNDASRHANRSHRGCDNSTGCLVDPYREEPATSVSKSRRSCCPPRSSPVASTMQCGTQWSTGVRRADRDRVPARPVFPLTAALRRGIHGRLPREALSAGRPFMLRPWLTSPRPPINQPGRTAPRSTRQSRIRHGCMTTFLAARTISRPPGSRPRPRSRPSRGRRSPRAARAFLRGVIHLLATEAGIRQFLDIGAGLPSGENVHQVAQSAAPDAAIGRTEQQERVQDPASGWPWPASGCGRPELADGASSRSLLM